MFDDFLGKIRLDPASLSRDDGKIGRFISLIQRDKGKRFVLTTRAYILEAARAISETLDDRRVEMSEMVLNLSTYTRELKARILYNHLYHSDIDRESVQALLIGDTVRQIVDHRNYMPRIIQWMTDEIRQRGISPSEYPKAFLQTLESPDKIWDKAFRQHISQNAQILLYCMYFAEHERFSEPGVRLDKLRIFFDRAVVNFGAALKEDLRSSLFEETLREVKSSFVVIDGDRANFINPSVQDFLFRNRRMRGFLARSRVPPPRWRAQCPSGRKSILEPRQISESRSLRLCWRASRVASLMAEVLCMNWPIWSAISFWLQGSQATATLSDSTSRMIFSG
ncbi:hypothetical protein LZK82_16865 [Rhizobium leguminosarum]|nr:hypothetical protein LZK82_16865 [Rhizobium leguminosarum]